MLAAVADQVGDLPRPSFAGLGVGGHDLVTELDVLDRLGRPVGHEHEGGAPEEWLRTRAAVSRGHPAEIRANAARILGKMADKRAVDPLIEVLDTRNVYTKRAAAVSLGKLADQRAIDPLTAARRTRWNTELDHVIEEALRKLRKQKRQPVP